MQPEGHDDLPAKSELLKLNDEIKLCEDFVALCDLDKKARAAYGEQFASTDATKTCGLSDCIVSGVRKRPKLRCKETRLR